MDEIIMDDKILPIVEYLHNNSNSSDITIQKEPEEYLEINHYRYVVWFKKDYYCTVYDGYIKGSKRNNTDTNTSIKLQDVCNYLKSLQRKIKIKKVLK